jgi:SNF2 family DNA or RNA helicase
MSFSRKFKKFWDVLTAGKSMEELKIPDSIHAELRPYQERGFHWLWFLYTYGLNGVLADDMGLGKTLQALVMLQQAHERHDSLPSLIVCPTTLVYNWMNEIRKFTPGLSVMNLTGSERFDRYQEIKNHDLVITSYAILRRDINALKDYEFRFVILDESQNIKNHESQTAMAAKQLQSRARLALSGTPIENRLSELWSLFDFLMPGFLDEYSEFRRRFIQPIEERGNRDMERRLKKQVFPFMLRRMKRDVLQDLPPKLEMLQYCDLTDDQYGLYMRILEKTRDELMEEAILKGGKPNQNAVFRALVRLRQVCNHPSLLGEELSEGIRHSGKFEALKDLLESAVDNGHRILVFSQFVEMLKLIKPWLEKKGYRYEMLTGQTKNRQEAVDRFNNDEGIPIFLVSLKAGGTGLNLTGADCVIHYDPWWNPAAEDQATDRVHRIGQTKKVFVYRLITRGTVEEKIMRLKDRKRDLVDSIIAADRTMGKKLSLDDLKDILSVDF